MTEMVQQATIPAKAARVKSGMRRRYAAEARFKFYGIASIVIAIGFLGILLWSIFSQGISALWQAELRLQVTIDAASLGIEGDVTREQLEKADYMGPVRNSLYARFPDVTSRADRRRLTDLISASGAPHELRKMVLANPALVGQSVSVWLPAATNTDQFMKGNISASSELLNKKQVAWVDQLSKSGELSAHFNSRLFTNGDSREPELAGVWGAVVGSFYSLLITLVLSFPLGVATAIYLEEFAPKNKWTDLIEVNINNLAAVPSIVFGLLGLAVFLQVFGLPRSAPLVGGLVLTLISLPTVIIASRAAIKAVPPSIREAALGIGASKLQTVTHHVLPLAMPGMLTGTILGMAHALGETAPLLMIGMVAFIVDIPGGPTDPAAVLPVQIYLWADSPERGFVERTSAAIMVLLFFLALMNAVAIYLRKKFERQW
jgi:phosphate transport system permease protein